MESAKFIFELRQAVAADDSKALEDLVIRSASYVFRGAPSALHFPDEAFRAAIDVMRGEAFRSMVGSHYLLELFIYDWANLSEAQRDRLLPELESLFLVCRDPMSPFVIAELLGEHYKTVHAVDALLRLLGKTTDDRLEHLVHGLEKASKLASPPAILRAEEALKKMRCE